MIKVCVEFHEYNGKCSYRATVTDGEDVRVSSVRTINKGCGRFHSILDFIDDFADTTDSFNIEWIDCAGLVGESGV